MLFSSIEFIFLFLPFSLALYFFTPKGWRNLTLLLTSLFFYGWGEPIYLFLMTATIAVDWSIGLGIRHHPKMAKFLLVLAVASNLAILAIFKYLSLMLSLFGIENVEIPLPAGISFYTFQALSYVVDVYRGEAAQKSPIDFGAYITMFPQLVAGPIVRYESIAAQLNVREHSAERTANGIERFVAGLGKKLIFANVAGEMWSYFSSLPREDISTLGAWLGILFFAFQIYFDFSGYSDMAIGLGQIFGFDFPENFNYPYTAKSARDFWRRWHISLSEWFREYLYIPLGGNRNGTLRTLLNMLAVWICTGLWHGASLNFVAWGLYYFLILSIERLFLSRLLDKLPNIFSRAYAIICILVGWVFFASPGVNDSLEYIGKMFSFSAPRGFEIYHLVRNIPLLLLLALGSTPIPKQAVKVLLKRQRIMRPVVSVCGILLFMLCVADLVGSSYNPFLYFRF